MPAPTDPLIAAQAMNMGDAGFSGSEVGRVLRIPDTTARDIINRHGRWGEVAERPVFIELRRQQKAHLEAASRALSAKCIMQAEQGLEKMSSYQAVGMYGIFSKP